MNRVDFAKTVAKAVNANDDINVKISQKDMIALFEIVSDVITETVRAGEDVTIVPGLTITRTYKPEHEMKLPQTGEIVVVPGKYSPKCKFGKAIKEAIQD